MLAKLAGERGRYLQHAPGSSRLERHALTVTVELEAKLIVCPVMSMSCQASPSASPRRQPVSALTRKISR